MLPACVISQRRGKAGRPSWPTWIAPLCPVRMRARLSLFLCLCFVPFRSFSRTHGCPQTPERCTHVYKLVGLHVFFSPHMYIAIASHTGSYTVCLSFWGVFRSRKCIAPLPLPLPLPSCTFARMPFVWGVHSRGALLLFCCLHERMRTSCFRANALGIEPAVRALRIFLSLCHQWCTSTV